MIVREVLPNDVAIFQGSEVDLVVRRHHPECLLDSKEEGGLYAGDHVAPQRSQATGHQAAGACVLYLELLTNSDNDAL